jgi:hypothetical protein
MITAKNTYISGTVMSVSHEHPLLAHVHKEEKRWLLVKSPGSHGMHLISSIPMKGQTLPELKRCCGFDEILS